MHFCPCSGAYAAMVTILRNAQAKYKTFYTHGSVYT